MLSLKAFIFNFQKKTPCKNAYLFASLSFHFKSIILFLKTVSFYFCPNTRAERARAERLQKNNLLDD
jgi:hypothetical protein